MVRIRINPEEREGEFRRGVRIIDAADKLGVDIENLCGGRGRCGKCKVIVEECRGGLSPLTEVERALLTEEERRNGFRLACRTKLEKGFVAIKVPEKSRRKGQIVLTEGRKVQFTKDPIVERYPLRIRNPSLEDHIADYERVREILRSRYDLEVDGIDYLVQQKLPKLIRRKASRDEEFLHFDAILWRGKEIIGIESGDERDFFGIAFDLGTTSIVGYLLNLESGRTEAVSSILNPQVKYGEDLMTRISHVLNHERGGAEMKKLLIDGINEIKEALLSEVGIEEEQIYGSTFVGNTAMQHFFFEIFPDYLSKAPYIPARKSSFEVKTREIGIGINPSGYVYWLPVTGGWVGADNVAAMLVSRIFDQSGITLLIDIGTNGEVAIGNGETVYVTSTAAGPALEGAAIEHGMRAKRGSIEVIKVDPKTLSPTFETIGDIPPVGICGSGIVDATAEMLKAGIILKDGRFEDSRLDNKRIRKRKDGILEYVVSWKDKNGVDSDITITQKDIREIQKAKGAMQAASRVLMGKLEVDRLDQVFVAGAFGNYVDKVSAMTIGLYPECDLKKVELLGNAAGEGAKLALLDEEKREQAERISELVEFVEIAGSEDFNDNFMRAMHFPHMDPELYPRTSKIINTGRWNVS